MLFGPYAPIKTNHMTDPQGVQYIFNFGNGFGASVVRNAVSYGHEEGLYELAVLDQEGHLCYSTPITGDVLGWLTPEKVVEHLCDIQNLAEIT